MNILVLCTGNSARSILLDTLLNRHGGGRVTAFSAGSHPTGKVHSETLKLLRSEGIDVRNLRSESWDIFARPGAPSVDAVITVCGNAATQSCPIRPGAPARAHWGVDDPAAAAPEDWASALRTTYDTLQTHALRLMREPFETMDRPALQSLLNRIGTTS